MPADTPFSPSDSPQATTTMGENAATSLPTLQPKKQIHVDPDSNASTMAAEHSQPSTPTNIQDPDAPSHDSGAQLHANDEWDTQQCIELQNELLASSPPTSCPENRDCAPEASIPNITLPPEDLLSLSEAGSSEITKLSEFTLFPKLPPELRLKVWKLALPGPRIVEIEWHSISGRWFSPREVETAISGLYRTNKESREVYLSNYVPFLELGRVLIEEPLKAKVDPYHEFSQHATSFFDPTIDTVYIGPASNHNLCITTESLTALAAMPWMKKVALLAVEYKEWYDAVENDTVPEISNLSLLPNLQEMVIAIDDIDFQQLTQKEETWAVRPPGEIEFIDMSEGSSAKAEAIELFLDVNEDVPPDEILKLSVKLILRGGITPEVVTGMRDCPESEEEAEEV